MFPPSVLSKNKKNITIFHLNIFIFTTIKIAVHVNCIDRYLKSNVRNKIYCVTLHEFNW